MTNDLSQTYSPTLLIAIAVILLLLPSFILAQEDADTAQAITDTTSADTVPQLPDFIPIPDRWRSIVPPPLTP